MSYRGDINEDPMDWDFRESPDEEAEDLAQRGRWGGMLRINEMKGENEMAEEKKKAGVYLTPIFRVSFPQVFEAKAFKAGMEPKYSLGMLFPKDFKAQAWASKFPGVNMDVEQTLWNALRAAASAAAEGKWGADRSKWPVSKIPDGKGGVITVPAIASPFHDGTEKSYEGYTADVIYATASAKQEFKPQIVNADLSPLIARNEFYGGCYARAKVSVFAYENLKLGVSLGLRNIQKVRDGEPFTGATKAEDDFDAIAVPAGSASSATATPAGAAAGNGLGI